MKFFSLLILLSVFNKCNHLKKDDFCTSLNGDNRELMIKILSTKNPLQYEKITSTKPHIYQNEILDSLKTLEIYDFFNGNKKDTTYSYLRYSGNYELLERRKTTKGKEDFVCFYEYDNFGNLIKKEGRKFLMEWKYDEHQNLIEKRSNRNKYSYEYNDLKITEHIVSNINNTDKLIIYLYDKQGRCTYQKATSLSPENELNEMIKETSYENSPEDNISIHTSTTSQTNRETRSNTTEYHYNDCGILERQISYKKGSNKKTFVTYEYEIQFTDSGLLQIVTIVNSNAETIKTYDEKGNWIHAIFYRNGEIISETIRELEYK